MIRPYQESDYPIVVEWLNKHGMPPKNGKIDFPEIGYIDPEVGVGFLIKTELKSAIIDFFISNPDSNRRNRSRTMDNITSRLIQHARWLKLKSITCTTNVESNKKRAERYGFKPVGEFTNFCKEL